MGIIRCPYCHENIESRDYRQHEAEHVRLLADGQQTDYVSLPPEDRVAGPLHGVPQVYRHNQCGTLTQMPEEAIRSYLKNPYLYMADKTFCCGCGVHVPFRDCVWAETGEDLQAYTDRLRAAKPEFRPGILKRMGIRLVRLLRP